MRAGLQRIEVGARPLQEHAETSGQDALDRIEEAAAGARGTRVLHLSSAGGGGAVPDLLRPCCRSTRALEDELRLLGSLG